MIPTPQTYQQIERAIRRMAENFPQNREEVLTDIHLQVKPSSGELLAFDDNDEELTRVVVEQWLDATGREGEDAPLQTEDTGADDTILQKEDFYEEAAAQICRCLEEVRKTIIDSMSVMRPFSFVLVDEDGETLRDLYLVDDDTVILNQELLQGLDDELDQFLRDLMK